MCHQSLRHVARVDGGDDVALGGARGEGELLGAAGAGHLDGDAAVVTVGEGAILLGKTCSGQDDIGKAGGLSVKDILKAVMPAIQHPNQDVRNASGKILLDVHKLSGCVTAEELEDINEKARMALLEKLANVEIEKNLNT